MPKKLLMTIFTTMLLTGAVDAHAWGWGNWSWGNNNNRNWFSYYRYRKPASPPVATATPRPVVTATPKPVLTATPKPVVTATPKPVITATPLPTVTVTPKPVVTPTTPPTSTAKITVTPGKSTEVLANPFKGFVSYLDGASDSTVIPMSLVWDDVTWRQLEPSRGNFDWATFEKGWAHQVSLGRKIGFRFELANPWIAPANGIPDWLINMGVPMRAYTIDGGGGNAPDWDNPTLLAEHARVLKALGARYNNDPRVAFIDIGSYGFWGEWHVWLNPSLAATNASKQKILNDYITNFPNKKLVIPFDDTYADSYVISKGQGIRNDCLGTSASNDYYFQVMNSLGSATNDTVYKSGIITGEFCGGTSGAIAGVRDRFSLNLNFIKAAHWSFIGPAGGELAKQTDSTVRANSEAMYKALGYHLVATSVSHEGKVVAGNKLNLSLNISNEGSAPFYYPWPVEVSIIDDAGTVAYSTQLSTNGWDIRQWLPGTRTVTTAITLPSTLSVGSYKVGIAIIDPATGKPGVRLGNTSRDTNGRYRFSTVQID